MVLDRVPHQRPKSPEDNSLTPIIHIERTATRFTPRDLLDLKTLVRTSGQEIANLSMEALLAGRRKAEQVANSIFYTVKYFYRLVYSQYRYLCGASEGHRLQKASRLSLPGETLLYGLAIHDSSSITRTKKIEDNARLGGTDVSEVVPFTLMLEGSVLWIQDFISAVAVLPYGFTKYLRGYGLDALQSFQQTVWRLQLASCCVLLLLACWWANIKRAALLLLLIVLCGLYAGLTLANIVIACCIIVALHWLW